MLLIIVNDRVSLRAFVSVKAAATISAFHRPRLGCEPVYWHLTLILRGKLFDLSHREMSMQLQDHKQDLLPPNMPKSITA